ncbi:Tfp pilus assembly protein FimT/FimU [Sulfurovum sp.]|uniref:pilus assembly FimT family protein n=1 Tax=Sulfurovum sp. TaxID=1969726 RepID=UPI00356A0EE6
MKRSAFTMIELVFVIVVLGILAALAMPRLDRDLKQEAADNILSSIRYTQHLALTDNKHKFDRTDWQSALWQIRFSQSGSDWSYSVATNMDYINNLDQAEAAIDPSNGQLMHSSATNPSPNILLTKKYGINTITFNGCAGQSASTAKHIAFDNLGRPHRGVTQGATNDYATYINNNDCQITFASPVFDSNLVIEIKKETGYAYIVGQPNS